jgi:hypothetical protein
MAYASRTGTRKNLDVLRANGWRLLVSARGVWRPEGFPYALDNGAWTAFQRQEPFDAAAFTGVVERLGADADWVVVPDSVGNRDETLRMADVWVPRLHGLRLLLAVQDGMTPADVPHLGSVAGIFVGGSTEWKLETLPNWGAWARGAGVICHIGRVNTARRIMACAKAGATSFDGSGPSRFAVEAARLSAAWREADRLYGNERNTP